MGGNAAHLSTEQKAMGAAPCDFKDDLAWKRYELRSLPYLFVS